MNIYETIKALVQYAENEKLIEKEDRAFALNRLLEALNLDSFEEAPVKSNYELKDILGAILDYACENGLCENSIVYRDLFDTKIMGILTPRPSEVIREFRSKYSESPEAATDYYYNLSRKSDYIREYRIKNDMKWVTSTDYGDIDITINLSKPEKTLKRLLPP